MTNDTDSKLCEIAKTIEEKYGIKACCGIYQMGAPCPYINYPNECYWGSECPECGHIRVWAADHCIGWHELCLNPECVMDK